MSDNNPQSAFDLAQFEAADTAVMDVMALDGNPLLVNGAPVTIELYGPGSAQFSKAQAKINATQQAKAVAALRGNVSKDGPSEDRKMNAEKFAACTKAINNWPLDALATYSNAKLGYIINQVAQFQGDWANFKPASSTN